MGGPHVVHTAEGRVRRGRFKPDLRILNDATVRTLLRHAHETFCLFYGTFARALDHAASREVRVAPAAAPCLHSLTSHAVS